MDKHRRRIPSQTQILFVFGLAGVLHETVISHVDRPFLLALFAGMTGVPVYFAKGSPPPETPPPTARTPRRKPKEAHDEA